MDMNLTQIAREEKSTDANKNVEQVGSLLVGTAVHPVVEGSSKIGRNPSLCQIVVNDPTVSGVHAEIQAGCKKTFISDVRSANGTKIEDAELKPFYYYQIVDGDAVYFGTVKATFTTTKSPKTPLPLRRLRGENTPGSGNASNSLFNNSSVYQSDDSAIPGTQRKEKDTPTFQEPSAPAGRRRGSNKISIGTLSPSASKEFPKQNEAASPRNVVESTDIHDLETQKFDEFASSRKTSAAKASLVRKFERESMDENIYDAETQIFRGETGNIEAAVEAKNSETPKNVIDGILVEGRNSSNNFSRELRISPSPSPPDSPIISNLSRGMMESQDLLELCETPLLQLSKQGRTDGNDADETAQRKTPCETDIGAPEKRNREKLTSSAIENPGNCVKSVFPAHVIAESDDESETDDDMDITAAIENRAKNQKTVNPRSTASDLIDDDDDDSAIDDEGKFASSASRSELQNKPTMPPEKLENRDVDDSVFESATEKLFGVRDNAADADKPDVSVKHMDCDADIDLLPTQILDVPTSTPLLKSRTVNKRSFEKKPIFDTDDEIYSAPTQILSEVDNVAVHDADKSSTGAAASRSEPKIGKKAQSKDTANLDDSLVTNLGRILYQEANNEVLPDEPMQLMTQNLVDILKPTQSFEETEPGGTEDDARESLGTNKRSKANSSGGFVGDLTDDDDILAGLPEVKISGTLSNPGSPCSSIASSHRILDSPAVPKNKRITKRKVQRKFIDEEEPDSDEVFGYNDLKKLADNLLAADSVDSVRSSDEKNNDGATDKSSGTLSSTGRKTRRVAKDIPAKNNASSGRKAGKVAQPPSTIPLSDGKNKRSRGNETRSIDNESSSSGIVKNSPSLHKSKKSRTTQAKLAPKQGEESQEVEAILAGPPVEDIALIARKSYATVNLRRMTAINVVRKNDDDDDDDSTPPKTARKRRATVAEPIVAVATKTRRTMGDVPSSPQLSKEQHKILVTGLDKDDYTKLVKKLGGSVVSEPSKATVLVTDKVRRTYKFLCAVARGLRIVSVNWLLDSQKAAKFLPCDDFILSDPVSERQWGFRLAKSLETARRKKLLEGYVLIITPKVNQPVLHELKGMVETCGGKVLTRAPAARAWNSKTAILSNKEDLTAVRALLSKCPKSVKVTVQTTEFILTGILRQEVNLVEHKLDIS